MVTDPAVLDSADANLRATWRAVSSLTPSPSVVERDGLLLIGSGMPIPLFNPVFVTAPLRDPSDAVSAIVEHYRGLDAPFVLWFREAQGPGLADACAAAGLVEHFQPPLMVMDPIAPAPPAPAGVEIVTADESNLDVCCDVLAEGFAMPSDLIRPLFTSRVLGLMTTFLALVDGVPAGTAACSVTGEVGGIYNVATVPSHRGKGVGAAVTWAAVAASAAAGATRSILQASEAGRPVYARMGFAAPDRYRQFEPAS